MTKKTFSIKVNDMMQKKLKSLEELDIEKVLKRDNYFEFILCLSYMTLSKEKIIDKDTQNNDRLDRLTKHVSKKDIDFLFSTSFNKVTPTIHYAKENDNLWILDNIRDSIMHECFIIDENKKCIIINNEGHDRELNAEIPFSWFIKYAKNDILSKKITDYHVINGFYYNKNKESAKYINTSEELNKTLFYKIIIKGNKFNIDSIQNRIEELFIENSKNTNEEYKTSFNTIKNKIINTLKKEYPDLDIDITLTIPGKNQIKKIIKQTQPFYKNYNLYFESISKIIKPKSNELLKYIKRIIKKLDTKFEKDSNSEINKMNLINSIMNEKDIIYSDSKDIYKKYKQNLKDLRTILLNIYGVATLVINHDNFYNKSFKDTDPQAYGLFAYSKQTFEEFLGLKKQELITILKKKINVFEKEKHLSKCKKEEDKIKLTNIIFNLKKDILTLENDFSTKNYIREYIPKENEKVVNYINSEIKKYIEVFNNSNSVDEKNKMIELISELIDRLKEYVYVFCDIKEAIRIIRNSFSHVGRIYIGKDKQEKTIIILNDYDNNNKKTGQVLCNLENLLNIINEPLEERKKLLKHIDIK